MRNKNYKKRRDLPMPSGERKPDTSMNGDLCEELVLQHRVSEKKLYPLRIDARTALMVPVNKCTKEYADYCLHRMEKNKCQIQDIGL